MTAIRFAFLVVMLAAVLAMGGLRGEARNCRGLAGCPHGIVEVQP